MSFDARADRQFRDEPELGVDLRAEFLRQLIADAGTGKSEFDDDLRGIANDLGGRDRAGGDEAATDQRMNVSVEGGQQGVTGTGRRTTSGKKGEAAYTGGPDDSFSTGKNTVTSLRKAARSAYTP